MTDILRMERADRRKAKKAAAAKQAKLKLGGPHPTTPYAKKKPKPRITRPAADPTLEAFQLLLQAIPELYPRDNVAPGLTLAYLPSGNFYGSICRYEGSTAQGSRREVLFAKQAATFEELISMLAETLLTKTEHVQKLKLNIRRRAKP